MCQTLTHVCLGTWDPRMEDPPDCEVPPSDQICNAGVALRTGALLKMTGRGWLFSSTWKRRFCVLTPSTLYFYDKEHSTGRDKSCGALNLHYFDVCEEDPKKPLSFSLDSSVKAFYDNRHQFCCDTPEDAERWIASIRKAITEMAVRKSRRKNQAVSSLDCPPGTPDRLVGAHKDRVKGPQGRRPPQRKSLMPASKSDDLDLDGGRQRSVSLSGPQRSTDGKELPTVTEGKWLSLSMEEVDLEKDEEAGGGAQRSSSAADIPQPRDEGMGAPSRKGPRGGNLLFQHAALAKELETRLKTHNSRLQNEDVKEDAVSQQQRSDDQLKHQVKTALQEVEHLKAEYRLALEEAREARREFQNLKQECRELLNSLKQQQQ